MTRPWLCWEEVRLLLATCGSSSLEGHSFKVDIIWGTPLVVQWSRIRWPVQGTWVRILVREDPTCLEATKPMRHNYWTHMPLLKPARLEPVLHERCHRNESLQWVRSLFSSACAHRNGWCQFKAPAGCLATQNDCWGSSIRQ